MRTVEPYFSENVTLFLFTKKVFSTDSTYKSVYIF